MILNACMLQLNSSLHEGVTNEGGCRVCAERTDRDLEGRRERLPESRRGCPRCGVEVALYPVRPAMPRRRRRVAVPSASPRWKSGQDRQLHGRSRSEEHTSELQSLTNLV